jgi:hypothetical protein
VFNAFRFFLPRSGLLPIIIGAFLTGKPVSLALRQLRKHGQKSVFHSELLYVQCQTFIPMSFLSKCQPATRESDGNMPMQLSNSTRDPVAALRSLRAGSKKNASTTSAPATAPERNVREVMLTDLRVEIWFLFFYPKSSSAAPSTACSCANSALSTRLRSCRSSSMARWILARKLSRKLTGVVLPRERDGSG